MRELNFVRMDNTSKLIQNLKKQSWWSYVKDIVLNNKDFNVQIRKDYINVYYKMANFLKIKNTNPIIEIHYKYIPTKSDNDYIKVEFDENNQANIKSSMEIISNDIFNRDNLDRIKKIIEKYNPNNSEKAYQSKLIDSNKEIVIDAEIAYSNSGRIDIMIYDDKIDKIIAVEFKMITDSRLYTDEIKEQLQKYEEFMTEYNEEIKQAYINSTKAKLELGLLQEDSKMLKISENTQVEHKPILAIAGLNQEMIDNFGQSIKKRVNDFAYFVKFFGKSANLLYKSANSNIVQS